MASSEAIKMLVEEDFVQACEKENHEGRERCVLELKSCQMVCTKCISDDPDERTITVVKHEERNAVWLDEVTEFVDCSSIQTTDINGRMLIHLKANHVEDNLCELENFCSLACKLKPPVKKKKRTGGRIRADITIFHPFSVMMMTREPRSGGRRRRSYEILDGDLPLLAPPIPMDLTEAIQRLVQEDFVQVCAQKSRSISKIIFRFVSGDAVCSKCNYDVEATIRVVIHKERNSVCLRNISKFVDCSQIRGHIIEDLNMMVIHLRENHMIDNVCEVDNFCSLACKLDHVINQFGTLSVIVKKQSVKKKRTGGRKRGEISIFHGFFRLFLFESKPRSGGRRRRTYGNQVDRHLPPKKRNRGAE